MQPRLEWIGNNRLTLREWLIPRGTHGAGVFPDGRGHDALSVERGRMDDETLQRIEAQLLDAATDPAAWQAALETIARQTGAKGAALLTVKGQGPLVLPTQGMGELAQRYVADGWYQRDFRYAGVPTMRQRGWMVDQDFVTAEQMDRMDYYQEFLRPLGFGWFAGLGITTGDDLWCLTLQRGAEAGAFLDQDQRAFARLVPVASRAATLARELEFNRLDGMADAIEIMRRAAFFIDRFGKVVRMTAAAEAMVGRVIELRAGKLRLGQGGEALERHLSAAIWPELAADAAALEPVAIRRPGAHPLILRAVRLRGDSRGFFVPAVAVLMVTDLDERAPAPLPHLDALFDLTPAEVRLAGALLGRFSLVDAAAALRLTHETARTQIKSVYAKTGTGSQAELIDLLGRVRGAML
ncbi:helix-turn-helix transcriptional regulator [Bosea sp. (in: a-proteobacteria)]|uniref:helix-turn-helix transcriptional regulator n=1 Tax=Bosea sp. (in: a-proteobacteria) TaxID=1871050 RepID=UPI003B3B2344